MKPSVRLIVLAGIAAGMFCSAYAYNGKNVNARTVSVQWRFTKWFYSGGGCPECNESQVYDGSICVYTITNAAVTKTDTIYKRELGLAQYANFDLTGNRIAFFRKGVAPSGSSLVQVNGGKNYISIINANGSGLVNLCEIPGEPGRDEALDWPAGEWIYYVCPKSPADATAAGGSGNTNSVDIWKVNAVSGVNQRVCDFSGGAGGKCQYWRRFSLDLGAAHMAGQSTSFYGCTDAGTFSGGNALWNFPPANCSLSSGFLCSHPACNIAISPSGALIGTYFAGSHNELFINGTDPAKPNPDGFAARCGIDIASPTLSELASWAGASVGSGCEHIGWAVNSDKWALQEVGWVAHADQLAFGSNQVAANWVDQVAINISRNPPSALTSGNEPSGIAWNNATGDMWINDPVNNPNKNRYEDLQGVWHDAPGATIVQPEPMMAAASPAFLSMRGDRELGISLPSGKQSEISISTLSGKTVLRSTAVGPAFLRLPSLSAGVYCITATTDGSMLRQKMVLK